MYISSFRSQTIVRCVFKTVTQLYFFVSFFAEASKFSRISDTFTPKSLAASAGCGVIIVASGNFIFNPARIFRPSASIIVGFSRSFNFCINFLNQYFDKNFCPKPQPIRHISKFSIFLKPSFLERKTTSGNNFDTELIIFLSLASAA